MSVSNFILLKLQSSTNDFETSLYKNTILYTFVFSWDWMEIRDGPEPNSQLISTLCGDTIPEPIISSGNELYVHFHSDASVGSTGFEISVSEGKEIYKIFQIGSNYTTKCR